MALSGVTDLFTARRLTDGSTISLRAIADEPFLFLTRDDGREAFRRITLDVAEAYWVAGRNLIADVAIEEMRSELGIKRADAVWRLWIRDRAQPARYMSIP